MLARTSLRIIGEAVQAGMDAPVRLLERDRGRGSLPRIEATGCEMGVGEPKGNAAPQAFPSEPRRRFIREKHGLHPPQAIWNKRRGYTYGTNDPF